MAMRQLLRLFLLAVLVASGAVYSYDVSATAMPSGGQYKIFIPNVSSTSQPAALAPAPAPTTTTNPQEAATFALFNQQRQLAGCPVPLAVSPELSAAARGHSLDMAVNNNLSHTGSDGSQYWNRAKRAGYQGFAGGEIIGFGYTSAAAVVDGWLNSSGHRAIMLDCQYDEVGIGYVYEANDTLPWKYYWTAVFGIR